MQKIQFWGWLQLEKETRALKELLLLEVTCLVFLEVEAKSKHVITCVPSGTGVWTAQWAGCGGGVIGRVRVHPICGSKCGDALQLEVSANPTKECGLDCCKLCRGTHLANCNDYNQSALWANQGWGFSSLSDLGLMVTRSTRICSMAQLFECAFVFIASDSSAEAQELQVLVAPLVNHGATNAHLLHCRLNFPCKPEVGLNFISSKFSFCGLHWLMTHNIVLWQVSVPCNKIFVSHWTTNNTTLNLNSWFAWSSLVSVTANKYPRDSMVVAFHL